MAEENFRKYFQNRKYVSIEVFSELDKRQHIKEGCTVEIISHNIMKGHLSNKMIARGISDRIANVYIPEPIMKNDR